MRSVIAAILVVLIALPLSSSSVVFENNIEEDLPWWETTSMDLDRDGIHDAIWLAINSEIYDWVSDDNTISVIVDFDHKPTLEDQQMLEHEVDFQTQFRYHLIDSIAGQVSVDDIVELSKLPGVVLVELDGILTIQMNEVNDVHGIPMIWEETGYTGKVVSYL